MKRVRFSSRLTWVTGSNPVWQADARARARAERGGPLFDLTTSNPTHVGLPYPVPQLAAALGQPGVSRHDPDPFGSLTARAAVCQDHARRGIAIAPDRLVLTASSSESYSFLFRLLGNPGDVVLVPTPSYPLFEYLAALDGLVVRPYRLWFDGDGWRVDVSSVDLTGACALVMVNPNNPTGSLPSDEELAAIATMCAQQGVALISDEVFADYAFAPRPDAAPSALGRGSPALTFALGGLSKGSGLPQLKLGWIAVDGPPACVAEALNRLELIADTYLSVGAPVQLALPELMALAAPVRAAIRSRIQTNRATMTAVLGNGLVRALPSEAGWAAILRVPHVIDDEAWAIALADQDQVLVQPGYFFDLAMGATLVVSLLPDPDVFEAGCKRVVARAEALVPA